MPEYTIRDARESDVDALCGLVHDLAEFEKAADECTLTAAQLREALFGEHPTVFSHVAELDGTLVGFTLWFRNYSTWRGTHGIYMEELYVSPAQRGTGLGKALLVELARECVRHGYARLEWSVLNWNPAVDFYRAMGAEPMDGWTVYRLTDAPLRALAT